MPPKRKRTKREEPKSQAVAPKLERQRGHFSIEGDRLTIDAGVPSSSGISSLNDILKSTTIRRLRFVVPPPPPLPPPSDPLRVGVTAAADVGASQANQKSVTRDALAVISRAVIELLPPRLESCVEEVIVEDGITDIEGNKFCKGFASLKVVRLPSSLETVGSSFLFHCASLTSIEFPRDGLTSFGDSALNFCPSLTSISLPDTVTSVGDQFLYACEALTTLHLPSSLTQVGGEFLVGCSSLRCLELPDGITALPDQAIYGCTSLTSVRLPSSLTSVGNWFLSASSSLAVLDLPDSLIRAADLFLIGCPALREVRVSAKLFAELKKKEPSVGGNSLVRRLLELQHIHVVERDEEQK